MSHNLQDIMLAFDSDDHKRALVSLRQKIADIECVMEANPTITEVYVKCSQQRATIFVSEINASTVHVILAPNHPYNPSRDRIIPVDNFMCVDETGDNCWIYQVGYFRHINLIDRLACLKAECGDLANLPRTLFNKAEATLPNTTKQKSAKRF